MSSYCRLSATDESWPNDAIGLTQLLSNSFTIIAVFTPVLWFLAYLREQFPVDTPLLSIGLLNLLLLFMLLILPVLALRKMNICWCWLST